MENSLLEFHYNSDNALEYKSHRLQAASAPPMWQMSGSVVYLDGWLTYHLPWSVLQWRLSSLPKNFSITFFLLFSFLSRNQDKSLFPLPNSVDTDNFRGVQECYLSLGLRRSTHFPNCPLDSSRTVLGLTACSNSVLRHLSQPPF